MGERGQGASWDWAGICNVAHLKEFTVPIHSCDYWRANCDRHPQQLSRRRNEQGPKHGDPTDVATEHPHQETIWFFTKLLKASKQQQF
jgi:hypothetical protein